MNKYEIIGVVGEGAYGIVLKCRNKETNEFVAIKRFKETDDDEAVRKSIQREVKMLRSLRHPNIIQLKEAFKKKGKIFLVFQFVERNLLELLEERKALDQETIKKIIFQLVLAVSCCHQNGIAHRDIKPENLLIDSDLTMKLCDFGFARAIHQAQEPLTDYVATRWYRSPELLISNNYGKPVDVWAIGCIMGELIDGQPLFPGENEMDQLYLIQKTIGPLTQEQMEIFQKNPRYLGMKFPESMKNESLEKRYAAKMCPQGMSFLRATLMMDPSQRLTIQECLDHPYLSEFSGKEKEAMVSRPISNVKRRISCEKDDSKPQLPHHDLHVENKSRKIHEKLVPTGLQNQSFMQNQVYNYKIQEDSVELKNDQEDQKHRTFNQSFKVKLGDNAQSRLGSENQDKRVNKPHAFPNIKDEQKTPTQGFHKSPLKKNPYHNHNPQPGGFYIQVLNQSAQQGQYNPRQVQQLNLVYNANTYNYSIKKTFQQRK